MWEYTYRTKCWSKYVCSYHSNDVAKLPSTGGVPMYQEVYQLPQQYRTVPISSDSPPHSAIKLLNLGNLMGAILNLSWVRLSKQGPYIPVTCIFLFCELSCTWCLKAYLDRYENGGAITSVATQVSRPDTGKGPALHDANLRQWWPAAEHGNCS